MSRQLVVVAGIVSLLALHVARAGGAPPDPDLQRLSAELTQLEGDPVLGHLGDADRLRAHQALDALAQTWPRSKYRALALHTVESRIAAARFAAQADLAERQLEQLAHERDRILLEASRHDADRARAEAERLRMQNAAREEEDRRAQAQRDAQAQQAAGLASDESAQAQALAQARANDAALAAKEAALQSGAKVPASSGVPTAHDARGPAMVLPGATFAEGTARLRNDPGTKARLQALLDFVLAHPDATIRIEGHTDNRGDPRRNLSLSQQRADAVRSRLRAAGVPADRIQAVGLGAEQPVASNATAKGRERNQRVEIIVQDGAK